jgi:hypothetical protein
MKEFVNRWLSQTMAVPGILACGIRFPDNTYLTQSFSQTFPAEALDNAWRCASDTFQVLKINFFPHERVRWVYQAAFLYCARRQDGICLGIFTAKEPLAFDPDEIERLIAEFRSLGAEEMS